MTQKEFEDRIGRTVTEKEYAEADAVYMAAGDMDKDEFCKEWKKIGPSKLVKALLENTHRLENALYAQKLQLNECQTMLRDAAETMLAEFDSDNIFDVHEVLEQHAVGLIGRKEVVVHKIEKAISCQKMIWHISRIHLRQCDYEEFGFSSIDDSDGEREGGSRQYTVRVYARGCRHG